MKNAVRITILVLLLSVSQADAQVTSKPAPIKMTTCNWQPYAGVNLTNLGFASELLTRLFKRLGYETTIDILPWKRSMISTAQGKYDLAYNAYYSEERARNYALTDPYIHSRVYLCSRKESGINFTTLRELTPYRIGVVMGYVNSEEFDRAAYLNIDEAVTDLHNLKKLFGRRIHLAVVDQYVAVQLIKTSPFLIANVTDLTFHEPPLSTQPVHAAFSKAIPGYRERVKEFNRELKAMIRDGTFDTLMEIHNFK
ncbi:MAG: transporter substrate-binding domain-containing protein [Desulfobacterales bacterium]|nr:transporter substrate-binding domain-containing protein [Desulfobacterales bacterium]